MTDEKWDAELREVAQLLSQLSLEPNVPHRQDTLFRAVSLIEQMRTTFTHKANLLPLREACEAALKAIEENRIRWEAYADYDPSLDDKAKKQLEDALRGSASSTK